jgi:cytosine permease
MISKKSYKESSLFWSWGAFVLLPINFFTGVLIAQRASVVESLFSIFLGFVILSISIYPVVHISISNSLNYSQSISKYININIFKKILILLVPIINVGWYSIQVAIVVSLLNNISIFSIDHPVVISIVISFLFSSGSFLFGYKWLQYFGTVAMVLLILTFGYSSIQYKWSFNLAFQTINFGIIWKATLLVIGSWIFSSVTCLMDITNYVKNSNKAFIYIVSALFMANILLIFMGFLAAKVHSLDSMEKFLSISGNIVLISSIIVSIWSTNDSNFFSTMKALEAFRVNKYYIYFGVSVISGSIASIGHNNLFQLLGEWLILMGWIGIPLSIFWWSIFIKDKITGR